MAGYNDQADALTLGDDDVLKVGDYELKYNSTSGDWEAVYTPTGDVAHVPKNQSGSLFPTDFADALAGQALADDGNLYGSVQSAEDAASNWVFVGPGTFNESVTIDTAGLTVMGSGYDTHVDGGTSGDAFVAGASNVTIQNLSVQTTAGGGTAYDGVTTATGADAIKLIGVVVRDTDSSGLEMNHGADHILYRCVVEAADKQAIVTDRNRTIIWGCATRPSVGGNGIRCTGALPADDCVVVNCIVVGPGNNGVRIDSNDCLVGGNRIHNAGNDGILVGGTDVIINNNRVSSSTNADIDDVGTGTVLDTNLTGAVN